MTNLTYHETYEVIANYANDQLEYFSDGWNRFPQWNICNKIAERLEATAKIFANVGEVEKVERIYKAVQTLHHYATK